MNILSFLNLDIYESLNIGGLVELVNNYLFRIYDETNMVNSLIFSLFMLLLTKAFTSTKTTCRCRFLCYVNILVEIILTRILVKYMSSDYLKISVRLNRSISLFFFIFYLFFSYFKYTNTVSNLSERVTRLECQQQILIMRLYGNIKRSLSGTSIDQICNQNKQLSVPSDNAADLMSEDEGEI